MPTSHNEYYILIVEDTAEFARLTMLTLKRFGFTAEHAKDAEVALDMMDARRPGVVLLDLNLPGMSGWELLQEMSKRYGEGQIPVIVTTAYGDNANRVIGKLQAVQRYLVKPFTPQELVHAVEIALGIEQAE